MPPRRSTGLQRRDFVNHGCDHDDRHVACRRGRLDRPSQTHSHPGRQARSPARDVWHLLREHTRGTNRRECVHDLDVRREGCHSSLSACNELCIFVDDEHFLATATNLLSSGHQVTDCAPARATGLLAFSIGLRGEVLNPRLSCGPGTMTSVDLYERQGDARDWTSQSNALHMAETPSPACEDGRAAFVSGAVPGDVVRAEIVEDRERFVRARTVEVLTPSPDRVSPPCPYFGSVAAACGSTSPTRRS